MRKLRQILAPLLLTILLSIMIFGSFWFGLVPQQFSPFPRISLAVQGQWFLDPRLAMLRNNPSLCRQVLVAPYISAPRIKTKPIRNGCGWTNAVALSRAGTANIAGKPLTCEMAAAVTLWTSGVLQPAAEEMFGHRVKRIHTMGTYGCRNIVGNRMWRNTRSQHATANAIDISAFTLTNGARISVLKHWNSTGNKGKFLRKIHRRSCRYFRVSLSPNFNVSHRDHFHFDRGPLWTCR
jgi:hypothetical protein